MIQIYRSQSCRSREEQIFFRLFFALVPLSPSLPLSSSLPSPLREGFVDTRRGGSTLRDYSEIFGEKFSLWNSMERD